jgi:hypothetical protein
MQHEFAPVRAGPVLVEVDALLGSEHRPAFGDRVRELGLRQRCPDMGRHIVRPLILMPIATVSAIGYEVPEKHFQISLDIWGGVLLDQQGCRGVLAPDGQQASVEPLGPRPAANLIGNVHETSPARHKLDAM